MQWGCRKIVLSDEKARTNGHQPWTQAEGPKLPHMQEEPFWRHTCATSCVSRAALLPEQVALELLLDKSLHSS